MKKFLKHIGIFTILLIIPCIGFEIMLRHIPNSFRFKRELIETEGHRMKNIIIGSSVTNCSIIPSSLGDSTYNLSISGEWIPYNHKLLELYADYMPNVKNIIWGIAYQTLWLEDRYEQDKVSITHHCIYMDISASQNIFHRFELMNGSIALRKWSKYYLNHQRTMWCDSLGTDHSYDLSERSADWKNDIAHKAKGHTIPLHPETEKIFENNLKHIDAVADMCRQKGIRLYFVIPPVHKDYYAQMDELHVNNIRTTLKKVTSKWSHTAVLDYLDDTRFEDDDFYDGSHLSSDKGAIKFSKILKDTLQLDR